MAEPSLRGGFEGKPPLATPGRVTGGAAALPRSGASPPSIPPQVWATVVLLIAGLATVSAEGILGTGLHRLRLPLEVRRPRPSLYQSTMQYLMDQLTYSGSSVRSDNYSTDVACMGAMYRREGGGSVCVDAVSAATVVGVALLLQLVFYLTVTTLCPVSVYSASGSSHRSRNITYVITVDNSNTIGMDLAAGDQSLDQEQTQDQTQAQTQSETGMAVQNALQRVRVRQDQDQEQDQEQLQGFGGRSFGDISARAEARDRQRRWTFPSLSRNWPSLNGVSLTLCPLLGRYLGH